MWTSGRDKMELLMIFFSDYVNTNDMFDIRQNTRGIMVSHHFTYFFSLTKIVKNF